MVLLVKDQLGRADFAEKSKVYAQSKRSLAEQVAREFSEWNMDSVRAYQEWMAELAVKTWRVDFE